MSVRDDVYVLFEETPRIVVVERPSLTISAKDLLETLRNIEPQPQNSDDGILIKASGGEKIGATQLVGYTHTLQNAVVAFEARSQNDSSGTATSDDAEGRLLTDSAATFISDGIEPGAAIINFTDKSIGTVIKVLSETQIKHFTLEDGTLNQWTIGDAYKIYNVEQCEITGGNVVAVDEGGNDISAVFPTAFTQVFRTLSTSASIANLTVMQQNLDIMMRVETGRWKMENNQMVIFDDDGVTPLITFNLFNEQGQPAMTDITERMPTT